MPRPYPPPPLSPPVVQPFRLGDSEKRDLAGTLGLKGLPDQTADMIEGAVAAYKATETGSPDTTVANTLAALDELKKGGRSYEKAVARLGHDCSGVDYTTHHALQDLAKAVARHEVGAREALNQAASARAEQLRHHVRVNTETESLRFFCGVLRLIFNNAASSTVRGTLDQSWYSCRRFALEVFTAAGIEHADFIAHPERLTEYLGTDMTLPEQSDFGPSMERL